MYNFLVNNGQRIAFGLGLIVTLLFLIVAFNGMDSFQALPEDDKVSTSIFDVGIKGAIAFIIAAAAGMIIFGLFQTFSHLKSSFIGILGFVALIAVFFIAFSSASGQASGEIAEAVDRAGGVSENAMKYIGGAITTALILLGLATAAFILSEIRNFFK